MTRVLLGPVLLVAWLAVVSWLLLAVPGPAPKPDPTATPRPTVFVFETPTLPIVTAGPPVPRRTATPRPVRYP